MNAAETTRLAGEAYATRLAHGTATTVEDKTRVAQKGYQSQLARNDASAQPVADESYKIGDKIGDRYEVSAIHHGAMGVVYGCFDHQTNLPRALKTVRVRYAHDKRAIAMFESEAVTWISLEKHPYIVRAYLVERFKNLPYVITDYVRGPEGMEGDLRGWLGHPRLTLPVAVSMALQIAQGMQHAVRKVPNLVHRDLKPANILVNGDGKAMVTDFGLVNAMDAGAGTPAYMSPEQWRSEPLDLRSDIYAYGCILFEMFTAHRLFPASSTLDWEDSHLGGAVATLASLVPAIPLQIDRFVMSCLEKDVLERPQNWDDVVLFFAEWYHLLTGKAVVFDFSSLALDAAEWITASYSLWNLKRYEEMLFLCERALKIDPTNAAVWSNKALALRNLNRIEESIQAANRALAIEPNDARMWMTKGNTLKDMMRFEDALQAHDRALAIDPNHLIARYNRGNVLWELKRYDEAIKDSEQVLSIDANYFEAWISKGNALYALNRLDEAIHDWDCALSIDSGSLLAWYNKGVALTHLKRYDEAIRAYDSVLAIDPKHASALKNKDYSLSQIKAKIASAGEHSKDLPRTLLSRLRFWNK